MDDPVLEPQRHLHALRGLERINRWSRSGQIVWLPIWALAQETGTRSLRVLDIATGAGDVPIRLWHRARRANVHLRIDGCDRNLRAVAFAAQRAARAQAEVRFFQWDALADETPPGYDVLISSLFLHHLDNEQGVRLLKHMTQAAGRMMLVNDLVRSAMGLALAYVGTRLLSTSDVVHTDGPRSVQAAYTIDEVHTLSRRAWLDGYTVTRRWPCRFLLTWRRR